MSACRCPERSRDPNGSTDITGLRFYLTWLRMIILQAHKVKAHTRGEGTITPEYFLMVSWRGFFVSENMQFCEPYKYLQAYFYSKGG